MKVLMLSWFRKDSILPGFRLAADKPSSPRKLQMKTSPKKTGCKNLAAESHGSTGVY